MLTSDSILWHVGVDYWPCLEKQFPQQWFANFLIEAPHVHSGILIPLGDRPSSHSNTGSEPRLVAMLDP